MKIIFKKIIKPVLKTMCYPLESMPNIYKFKQPILIQSLVFELNKAKHTILYQVLNLQSKIVGLIANNIQGDNCFVPCSPSQILPEYEIVYITDNIWNTYQITVSHKRI